MRAICIMFRKHVGRLTFLVNLFISSKNSKHLLWENNVLLLNYTETKQLGPSCVGSPCVKAQNSGENKALPVSRVLIKSPVCEQLAVLQED